jgi:hypothetical protein
MITTELTGVVAEPIAAVNALNTNAIVLSNYFSVRTARSSASSSSSTRPPATDTGPAPVS